MLLPLQNGGYKHYRLDATGMEFRFVITPRLPDGAFRKFLAVINEPSMVGRTFSDTLPAFEQEHDRTILVIRAYQNDEDWHNDVAISLDDPVFKETHDRYTRYVIECLSRLKNHKCELLQSGMLLEFHMATVFLRLDQWLNGMLPDGEIQPVKDMLHKQHANTDTYSENYDLAQQEINSDPRKAIKYFEVALGSMPPDFKTLDQRGVLPDSKIEYNFSWTRLAMLALAGMGDGHAHAGNYAESMKCYDECLELCPNDAFMVCNKGRALITLQKYEKAVECFDQALGIQPNYDTALFSKGVSLYALGDSAGASKCYDMTLSINPDYRDAEYLRDCLARKEMADGAGMHAYVKMQWYAPDVKCHMCNKAFNCRDMSMIFHVADRDSVRKQLAGYGQEIISQMHIYNRKLPCMVWGRTEPELLVRCPNCSNLISVFWVGTDGISKTMYLGHYLTPHGSFFEPKQFPGEPDYKKPQNEKPLRVWQCEKCHMRSQYAATTLYSTVRQDREVLAMLCKNGHEIEYPEKYDLYNGIIT